MKQVSFSSDNFEQKLFNALLNLKKVIKDHKFNKKDKFYRVSDLFFSTEFKIISSGLFRDSITPYNASVFLNTICPGFSKFYNDRAFVLSNKNNYFYNEVFELFIDFYMMHLLNHANISIEKTDVFKSDKDIYQKSYSMKYNEYKAHLKKWDDLDPMDFIVKYSPMYPVFKLKFKDNKFVFDTWNRDGEIDVKPLVLNDMAFTSLFNFYKYAGMSLHTFEENIIFYFVRNSRNVEELRQNLNKCNQLLIKFDRRPINFDEGQVMFNYHNGR